MGSSGDNLARVIRRYVPKAGMSLDDCALEMGVSRPTLYARHPSPGVVGKVREWLYRKVPSADRRQEIDAILRQLLVVDKLRSAGLPSDADVDVGAVPAVRHALNLPVRESAYQLLSEEATYCRSDQRLAIEIGQRAILKLLSLGRYRQVVEHVDHLMGEHGATLSDPVVRFRLLVSRGAARFRHQPVDDAFTDVCDEAGGDLSEAIQIREDRPRAYWRPEAHPEHYLARLECARFFHDRYRNRVARDRALQWFKKARELHAHHANDGWHGRDYLWEADLHRRCGDITSARRCLAHAAELLGESGSAAGWVRWQRLVIGMETEAYSAMWAKERADREVLRHWADVGYAAGVPQVLIQLAEWFRRDGNDRLVTRALLGSLCLKDPDLELASRIRRLRPAGPRPMASVQMQADALGAVAAELKWPFQYVELLGFDPRFRIQRALARHDVLGRRIPFQPELPQQELEPD
jgi:hypothetical protein